MRDALVAPQRTKGDKNKRGRYPFFFLGRPIGRYCNTLPAIFSKLWTNFSVPQGSPFSTLRRNTSLLTTVALISLAVVFHAWHDVSVSPLSLDNEVDANSHKLGTGSVKIDSPYDEVFTTSSKVSNKENKQNWGEIQTLKKEVTHLRADLAMLRNQFQAQLSQIKESLAAFSVSTEMGGFAANDEPVADPEKQEADFIEAELQRSLTRAQINETEFNSQSADSAWANQADTLIHEALTSEALKDSAVGNVQCRSTVCRVEVVHDNVDQRLQFEDRFPLMVANMLPSVEMHTIENGDGTSSTVAFLAREGYSLPQGE